MLAEGAGVLPFGQIFNLTRLRHDLRRPILEWSDVKHIPSTSTNGPPDSEREPLGCWSTRPEYEPTPLRAHPLLNNLRLDLSYTRVPTSTHHSPNDVRDDFVVFSKLVPYIFPHRPRRGSFDIMSPSPLGHHLPPDEQLSCFDHLYFVTSSDVPFEWEESWSPAWNSIGKYIHFTDELVEIAKGYLSRAFNTDQDQIPPVSLIEFLFLLFKVEFISSFYEQFIAIHDRRGDFTKRCKEGSCLNQLSIFAEQVNEIRRTLFRKHNKNITQVLLASGEWYLTVPIKKISTDKEIFFFFFYR